MFLVTATVKMTRLVFERAAVWIFCFVLFFVVQTELKTKKKKNNFLEGCFVVWAADPTLALARMAKQQRVLHFGQNQKRLLAFHTEIYARRFSRFYSVQVAAAGWRESLRPSSVFLSHFAIALTISLYF